MHCFWVTSSSHFQSEDLSFPPPPPPYLNPLCSCCFIFQAFVSAIRLLSVLYLISRSTFSSVSGMLSIFLSSSVSFLVKPVCTYCLNFSMQACRLLLQSLLLMLNPWTSSQWAGVKRILTL